MTYQRKIRPDYMVGTITLVDGDTNFTTLGASLLSTTLGGGDVIMTMNGRMLIIDEITSDDTGTLAYPCPPEEAGVDLPLRIRFQPSGSGSQAAIRDLLARWGNGNVDSFAALEAVLGGIPVFTEFGMEVVSIDDLKADDPHGNLAQLATIAKQSNHFLIMGADGSVALKPIAELTDAIENNRLAIVANNQAIAVNSTALKTKASYNWIINGDFTVNQRGGVKKPANGVYGFDRWRGHANGIEQIIEALPAGEYTLTWAGGGNGSFGGGAGVSPIKATVAAGDLSVVVPATAKKVSLVVGDATKSDPWPWCARPTPTEEILCAPYYRSIRLSFYSNVTANNSYTIRQEIFPLLRVPPAVTYDVLPNALYFPIALTIAAATRNTCVATSRANETASAGTYTADLFMDAEIYQ